MPHFELSQAVTIEYAVKCAGVFFSTVSKEFEFLDQELFMQRLNRRWDAHVSQRNLDCDALLSSIVALGSFFNQAPDQAGGSQEEEILAAFTKSRIDNAGVIRPPSIEVIASLVLRSIYLRATSRPHASWMASNVAMHLLLSAGLHRLEMIKLSRHVERQQEYTPILCPAKLFLVGRAVNTILSYEYSRPHVDVSKWDYQEGIFASQSTRDLLWVASLIPSGDAGPQEPEHDKRTRDLLHAVTSDSRRHMCTLQSVLLQAGIAFSAYRRLRLVGCRNPSLLDTSDSMLSRLTSIGKKALEMIEDELASSRSNGTPPQPWWGLVALPFHYVLILLSQEDNDCLALIPNALKTLKNVAACFDNRLVREAVETANALIKLSIQSKERGVKLLREALGSDATQQSIGANPPSTSTLDTMVSGSGQTHSLDSETLPGEPNLHSVPGQAIGVGDEFADPTSNERNFGNLWSWPIDANFNSIGWDSVLSDLDWDMNVSYNPRPAT
jgi:hypothetical protein